MMKRILLPLLMMLFAVMSISAASAQSTQTWLPDFDPDRHVAVDSRLLNHRTHPVQFTSLESDIGRASEIHNLKIFVVATELGSESAVENGIATRKLDELMAKWQSQPGFPTQDYLVILWVRYKDNPEKGSVAANAGSRLRGYGMTADHFAAADGPIIPVLKQHMRERPELALKTIVDNVNNEITAAEDAQKRAAEREKFMKDELPGILLWCAIIGIPLIVLLILAVRFFGARGRASAKMTRFAQQLERVSALVEDIERRYLTFLKANSDWESRLKGASLARLKEGLEHYNHLLSVEAAGKKRLADARKALASSWFPSTAGFAKCHELLTDTEVVVRSSEIELEVATLFGGLSTNETCDPDDLFDNGSELASHAEAAMAEIKDAVEGNDATRGQVQATIEGARANEPRLLAENLSLDPYLAAIGALTEKHEAFTRLSAGDPLAGIESRSAVEADARALDALIARAFELRSQWLSINGEIADCRGNVANLRATIVAQRFPLEGRRPDPKVETVTYKLEEKDGNPDPKLAEADAKLEDAHTLLAAGKQEESATALADARKAVSEAADTIARVFVAKTEVEENGLLVAPARAELSTAREAARLALAALESDFLPITFEGRAEKLARATSTLSNVDTAYGAVGKAYRAQNYLHARQLLAELLSTISEATEAGNEVVARLAILNEHKTSVKATVPECRATVERLAKLLAARAFTTSATTDEALAWADEEQKALAVIAGTSKPDWADAKRRSDELVASLAAIESDSNEQLACYERVVKLVSSLSSDVDNAAASITERTRAGARATLEEASAEAKALPEAVQIAKADWNALQLRASGAHEMCDSVRKQAAADQRNFDNARVKLAYCKTRAQRFGRRKEKLIAQANATYAEAREAFGHGDWQAAARKAREAFDLYARFERRQRRRVAALVTPAAQNAPGFATSAPPVATRTASSDDSFAIGVAIAIGMNHDSASGSTTNASSGSSSSSSSSSSPSYTPSYSSDSGGSSFSSDSGGGGFSGGSGGGDY